MRKKSDDELMEFLAKGNMSAFTVLFDRHAAKVLGYATKLCSDKFKGEDLSQDVWMRVIRYSQSYKSEGKFQSWLMTVTRNVTMNSFAAVQINADIADYEDQLSDETPNVDEVLSENENIGKMKQLLAKLPEAQRVALVMFLSEDLSYEEIAQSLKSTVPSVKSLIFRARQNLLKWQKELV